MKLRALRAGDDLMPFLLLAMNWRGDDAWSAEGVLADPHVAHYIVGWPRSGDGGVGAFSDGALVGAAWWRQFSAADPGYGYVADDIPELGIAVLPAYQGSGAGAALLDAAIAHAAREGIRGLSLSVEDDNSRARRLYETRGFVPVGRVGNSDTLLRLA